MMDGMKKGLTADDRREVAKNLMMVGNLAAGALVFGQAFSGFPLDLTLR